MKTSPSELADGGREKGGKVPRCFCSFFPLIPVTPLNPPKNKPPQTNKSYKTRHVSAPPTLGSLAEGKTLFWLIEISLCSPQPQIPPLAAFILLPLLFSVTAVKMSPRPSEDHSSDLREHPCNYICLNRGQILALARGQGLLHFPARENLRSMCVCAKYILQA